MLSAQSRAHGYATVAGVLLACLLGLALYAWRVDHVSWVVSVIRWLKESGPPGLRDVSMGLAIAGAGVPWIALISLFALALCVLGGLRTGIMLGVTAAMQDLGAALKLLVERGRPADGVLQVWREIPSYSFPSGHTLGATLVFGFLFLALEQCAIPIRLRRLLQAACMGWIVLMGLGRVQLGAHWPTDVLGAYLLGALCLLPSAYLLRRTPRAATVMRDER